MKFRRSGISLMILAGMLALCSCSTEPGETTTMGAATGGVLGAGLGAIVGSQSGDAGTGLAVGAVAGAGAGAMVGNVLEAQEQSIHTQDLAIEKQEQTIRTQQGELNDLRRVGQDRVVFKGQSARPYGAQQAGGAASALSRTSDPVQNTSRTYSSGLREATLTPPDKGWSTSAPAGSGSSTALSDRPAAAPEQESSRARLGSENPGSAALWDSAPQTTGALSAAPRINTPECIKAESEVRSVGQALEPADRLFHYRRALRMCPTNPAFHNGLGEVYVSLGRKTDAEFEFKEALKLDPAFDSAVKNLNALNQSGANQNDARY